LGSDSGGKGCFEIGYFLAQDKTRVIKNPLDSRINLSLNAGILDL